MVSDFLVSHPNGPFFSLNIKEYKKLLKKYPDFEVEADIDYVERTCTGSMQPGQDGYLDNTRVLNQFERLFKMLEFKKEYNFPVKHDIEFIVNNARTHTKMDVNINDIRLNSGLYCPAEILTWVDENGIQKSLSLFFDENGDENGNFKNQSKGLRQLANELGLYDLGNLKLPQLKNELKKHPAFSGITKLELLARKYGVKIIFCPKYHCEFSPTEGLWCCQKQYNRKYNDLTHSTMMKLIRE